MNAIKKIFAAVLGLALTAVVLPAAAQSCALDTGVSALPMVFPLTGTVTVGRDLKVGDLIYGGTARSYSNQALLCRGIASFEHVREFTRDPGKPLLDGTVYPTNVAGIGVRVWWSSRRVPFSQTFTIANPAVTTAVVYPRALDFSLVKTGTITGGIVRGSTLPGVRHSAPGWADLATYTFVGDLTVVTGTCNVSDFTVPMGTHKMSELSGVGTATGWKDFNIALTNCPAFFGVAWYDNWDGASSQQYRNANTVKLRIDPATTIVDAAKSVMALQQGSNYMARNIGIQVAGRANTSFGFGAMRDSGVTLTNAANGNYTIPLRARYIQTAANPSSGEANGAMTVTLEYL